MVTQASMTPESADDYFILDIEAHIMPEDYRKYVNYFPDVKCLDYAHVMARKTKWTNPVTGEEENPSIVLPNGFLFHEAHVAQSTASWVKDQGFERDQTGQNGYYAEIEYSNA